MVHIGSKIRKHNSYKFMIMIEIGLMYSIDNLVMGLKDKYMP